MAFHRKERLGIVVTDTMNKTINVKVTNLMPHPLYGKVIKKNKKYMAHDEKNEAQTGDKVLIRETRPLSKTKCWKLVKIIEKVKIVE